MVPRLPTSSSSAALPPSTWTNTLLPPLAPLYVESRPVVLSLWRLLALRSPSHGTVVRGVNFQDIDILGVNVCCLVRVIKVGKYCERQCCCAPSFGAGLIVALGIGCFVGLSLECDDRPGVVSSKTIGDASQPNKSGAQDTSSGLASTKAPPPPSNGIHLWSRTLTAPDIITAFQV